DPEHLYLRIDFVAGGPPGSDVDLNLEILAPEPRQMVVRGLVAGDRAVGELDKGGGTALIPGARCCIASILELAVSFASLGLKQGDRAEILGTLVRDGQVIESLPADDLIRFVVPDPSFEAALWSA